MAPSIGTEPVGRPSRLFDAAVVVLLVLVLALVPFTVAVVAEDEPSTTAGAVVCPRPIVAVRHNETLRCELTAGHTLTLYYPPRYGKGRVRNHCDHVGGRIIQMRDGRWACWNVDF